LFRDWMMLIPRQNFVVLYVLILLYCYMSYPRVFSVPRLVCYAMLPDIAKIHLSKQNRDPEAATFSGTASRRLSGSDKGNLVCYSSLFAVDVSSWIS
jgi:hypothetical protein